MLTALDAAMLLMMGTKMGGFFLRGVASAAILGLIIFDGASIAQAALLHVGQPVVGQAPQLVTFWGKPYPYGYVYIRPPVDCWRKQIVQTSAGPRVERFWVCQHPLRARY